MVAIDLPDGTPSAFTEPTLCAAFQNTVRNRGDIVALRTKGDATRITWREYGDRVRRYAGGLAGVGVRSQDAVAILMVNRPEFNVLDTAAIHLGAVPFSIYATSTVEQIRYLLADSGGASGDHRARLSRQTSRSRGGHAVRTIVVVDGDEPDTLSLAQLEASAPLVSTSRRRGARCRPTPS